MPPIEDQTMNMNTEQYAQALNVLCAVQHNGEVDWHLPEREAVAEIKASAIEKLDKVRSTVAENQSCTGMLAVAYVCDTELNAMEPSQFKFMLQTTMTAAQLRDTALAILDYLEANHSEELRESTFRGDGYVEEVVDNEDNQFFFNTEIGIG